MKEICNLNPLKRLFHDLLKLSKEDMDHRFAQAGVNITHLQYAVLVTINNQPATLNEIAKHFNVKPPSLVPVVDFLEKNNFLKKQNDLKDRRKVHLIITKKGSNLLKKVPFDDKNDALNKAFEKFSLAKQKQLLGLLEELTSNFK